MLAASLLFVASPLLITAEATAQVIVMGDGAAQGCYQYAKAGNQGSNSAIRECSDALERATLVRKDEAATLVNRGVLLMRKGDHDAAVEDYAAALALMPNLSEAHINHGVALYYQGRYAQAVSAYDRAIDIGSDKIALAHFNRALAHEQLGDARAAYYDLKAALDYKPDWEQAQTSLQRFTVTRPDS